MKSVIRDLFNKPQPSTKDPLTRQVKYATFNIRLVAAIIDIVPITMFIAYPICTWLEDRIFLPLRPGVLMRPFEPSLPRDQFLPMLWAAVLDQKLIERNIVTNGIMFVLLAAYIFYFWGKYNNTPGKMLLGLEIRDKTTHELMTRKQQLKRFLAYILSGIPFALGFIWMIFNRKRQGWHDKIAHTVVVIKERKPKENATTMTLKSGSL